MKQKRLSQQLIPAITVADIANALESHGARLRLTSAGSLIVGGLGQLPEDVRALFYGCTDTAGLVAHVRASQRMSLFPARQEARQ